MNNHPIINPAEEASIRQQVRMELEHKINQESLKKEQRATLEQEIQRSEEIDRIRKDEEIQFYTQRGYIMAGQTVDNSLQWKQAGESERVIQKKHRKRHHHGHAFSLKNYIKEIVFLAIFCTLLLMLIVYYKL